jgi:hypothetical protein
MNDDMPSMADMLAQYNQDQADAQFEAYMSLWKDENGAVTNKEEDNAGAWYDNTPEKKAKHKREVEQIREDLANAAPAEDKPKLTEYEGSWYDEFGRECDSKGNRY